MNKEEQRKMEWKIIVEIMNQENDKGLTTLVVK